MPVRKRGEQKTKETRMFKTSIDMPAPSREKVIKILNQYLADASDLYSQAKQSHWNVKGNTFFQLHELFDDIAESVLEWVDLIAERVTALGGYAEGTVHMAASKSSLPEYRTDRNDGETLVRNLAKSFAAFAAGVRKAIDETADLKDISTSDLFTEVSRGADKYLWFLEAHYQ